MIRLPKMELGRVGQRHPAGKENPYGNVLILPMAQII